MLAVVLAGGYAAEDSGILRAMTAVRRALTLDLLERLQGAPGVTPVLLTDDEVLQTAARASKCRVRRTEQPFIWLAAVQAAVREEARDAQEAVLVLGGCAAPFLTEREIADLRERARHGVVWQNNRLSPDMVLFAPAKAVWQVHTCATDNEFGYALEQQAGLHVQLLPQELAYAFDVDTPLDALLAALLPAAGQRLRAAATQMPQRVPLREVLAVLHRNDYPDVALLGRVHPPTAEQFGQAVGVRLRLYAEERGMKALGRIARGEVQSLVAELAAAVGWPHFFALLGQQASAVLFDTRVVFAHWQWQLSEHDRFAADLLLVEEIHDPRLRELVQAARTADVPVLLGGQALVSGGLRLLTAAHLQNREQH